MSYAARSGCPKPDRRASDPGGTAAGPYAPQRLRPRLPSLQIPASSIADALGRIGLVVDRRESMDRIAAIFTIAKRERGSMAAAVCLVLIGTLEAQAGAQERSGQAVPLRPSFDMRVDVPPTPVAVEGTTLLAYELQLTNFTRTPLMVRRIEVLDADDTMVVADLFGDALEHRLGGPALYSRDSDRPRSIAPGIHAVVYLDLPIETDTPPRALRHRVTYHVTGEDPGTSAVVEGASVPVDTEPRAPLGPPLRAGPWAAVYHPCLERGHRRVYYAIGGRARVPHRFAIDWMKLDSAGRVARGDRDEVANWYGYGAEVLAVADGVIAATRDHLPESRTLSGRPRVPLEESEGNSIVLDLGDGRYAFYGHLQPGSVQVGPGDHVSRGQVIGAVGFTGSAGGPQLHFHVADGSASFHAEGVPFEIGSFGVLGTLDPRTGRSGCANTSRVILEVLGNAPWAPLDHGVDSRRARELPAPYAVVDFDVGVPL